MEHFLEGIAPLRYFWSQPSVSLIFFSSLWPSITTFDKLEGSKRINLTQKLYGALEISCAKNLKTFFEVCWLS